MKNKFLKFSFLMLSMLIYIPFVVSQSSAVDMMNLDQDYLESLPESVREDVMKEIKSNKRDNEKNIQKRPSTKLLKNQVVREWEDFKNKKDLINKTERYGLKLFQTMQSSFMPLNEPNFGTNYIVDYGDYITIHKYGGGSNQVFNLEIERDGTILIPDIGRISLTGLNFEEVTELIKKKYEASYIGIDVFDSMYDKQKEILPIMKSSNPLKNIYYKYFKKTEPYSLEGVKQFLKKFERNVILYKGNSNQVLRNFVHKNINYIIIDGGHSYETVIEDLNLSAKILSPQGIIMCDDYIHNQAPGVKMAVDEFVKKNDFKIEVINKRMAKLYL